MNRKQFISMTLSGLAILLIFAAIFFYPKKTGNPVSKSTFLLDTVVTITLYGDQDAKMQLIEEAFALCKEYERLFSKTREDSDISNINNHAGTGPVTVEPETAQLLKMGLEYSRLSGGSFDITVGSLTSLWDFKSTEHIIPSQDSITKAVSPIGYESLHIDGNEITLDNPDTRLDTGAIAKGFIADRLKDFLVSKGEKSGIISLGGNILVIGSKPDGTPYKIGIQKPFEDRNETIETVEIRDMSVVSSGVYERHFVVDGKNYHHILNPKTGYPYDNGLTSVTIISPLSVDGDALSTVCFSLGLSDGMALVNSMPDIYGVFITENYDLFYSENFESLLSSQK